MTDDLRDAAILWLLEAALGSIPFMEGFSKSNMLMDEELRRKGEMLLESVRKSQAVREA